MSRGADGGIDGIIKEDRLGLITYLLTAAAVKALLLAHPESAPFEANLGTASGTDEEITEGKVPCVYCHVPDLRGPHLPDPIPAFRESSQLQPRNRAACLISIPSGQG